MKIKEQTRQLAAGCFEVVEPQAVLAYGKAKLTGLKRFSKSISCKMNDFLVLTLLLTKSSG
ncbi:hypothetical protein [Streptococcus pneumoniae]|uniref:hypothetical protein n=1 Tax=Streptococcus pneumoniae TaxID=1313 RepID=UPI0015DB48CC|nr:hypothetical protein [Streptococcus pneumoniae]